MRAGSVCRSKGNTALALNRRQFIRTGGAALAAAALTTRAQAGYTKLKIGATDWILKLEAKPASSITFAGCWRRLDATETHTVVQEW